MKSVNTSHITLNDVKKSFGQLDVLKGIDLSIQKGEFIAIVGKSGCGKSTLLRLIAGLESTCEGVIQMDNVRIKRLNERARMMFQDGRLLPWKRVIDNICIGLPKEDRSKAVEALKNVGLKDRMKNWPAHLSGGQKQRVALARALVHEPDLLLLDEPLGALDALTRIDMQDLIESLWLHQKFTAILVTHDVEEAIAIADRVILIKDGVVSLNQPIQLSRPRQRSHPNFSIYLETILDQIMDRKTSHQVDIEQSESPSSAVM
ncbi:MAG TPA: ATP-binding cassette domain-containing protein [Virgibacillus sp.]|nr:ATP-binding cassette domain-containing protein [Virgibacillus sp.]